MITPTFEIRTSFVDTASDHNNQFTDDMAARSVRIGPVSLVLADGDPRTLRFGDTEVLRRVSYPVRDENWGTFANTTLQDTLNTADATATYDRSFNAADGSFSGSFRFDVTTTPNSADIIAMVEITANQMLPVNRAGFTLLHPLNGVVGTPMTIHHPVGPTEQSQFPQTISPDVVAREIAGLDHTIGPVTVKITFEGDVFEMEDQRNWSDASFKTYCRPLAAPKPFVLQPGAVLRQQVRVQLASQPSAPARAPQQRPTTGTMPQVALAHVPGLSQASSIAHFPGIPILARITEQTPDADLAALADIPNLTLECVIGDLAGLADLAQRALHAGLRPTHVVALPRPYLASHQPQGPWPTGPAPADLVAPLRGYFPGAVIGGGSLANFTECNRCPPPPDVDYVTFGNTAIVHAADDASVIETLEALPHIFRSARTIARRKPLRLGLISIGMRSNPYGAEVADNPTNIRMPMARQDPRQATGFAAAYGVGILAAASRDGVESLALAMPDGPLGAWANGGPTPLGQIILAAAQLAGQPVTIHQGDGTIGITGATLGLAANLTDHPMDIPGAGTVPSNCAMITAGATP
jgi:D-apionolactonase